MMVMKTEYELETAIKILRDFKNTEVCRELFSSEANSVILERIKVLQWVLEEFEAEE